MGDTLNPMNSDLGDDNTALKKRLAARGADQDPEAEAHAAVCAEAERDFFRDHLA